MLNNLSLALKGRGTERLAVVLGVAFVHPCKLFETVFIVTTTGAILRGFIV